MEKKIYILENLDCANCAAKIEEKFNAHPGVSEAVITFATRQLRLTADDPDALIPELEQIARTVEKDVIIRARESGHGCGEQHNHEKDCCCGHAHHHKEGSCGHNHHHGEDCSCGHGPHHGEDCSCGHGHHHHKGEDKFRLVHPDTNWEAGVEYGEKIGLGSREYELIKL